MKKFVRNILFSAFLAVVGFGTVNAAPTLDIGVGLRTDLSFNSSDQDLVNEEDEGTKFEIKRALFNINGELNKKTSYEAQIQFNSSFEEEEFNSTNEAVELLYVDYKPVSDISVKAGKLAVLSGAVENDYDSINQYHVSKTNEALPADYEVGAEVSYELGGQLFSVQALDSVFHQENQKAGNLNLNVAWNGKLADGMIQPIVTYGVYPSAEQKAEQEVGGEVKEIVQEGYSLTQFGVGTKVDYNRIQFDVEYDNVVTPERSEEAVEGGSVVDNVNAEESITGIVFQAKYDLEKYQPFFKYTQDDIKVDGKDVSEHVGLAAGLEFFPQGVESYRLHAVYVNQNDKFEDQEDVISTQFNLGVTANF